MTRFDEAKNLLSDISDLGGLGFIVGGAVRDVKMGKDPRDIDILTNLDKEKLKNNWKTFDITHSDRFQTLLLKYDNYPFEISTYTGSIQENLKDRDFTINTMLYTKDGKLIDFLQGSESIDEEKIKAVEDDPYSVILADPIRMLRAVRLSSELGFAIDKDLISGISNLSHLILDEHPQRLGREILKMAENSRILAQCISTMEFLGLLKYVLPSIKKLTRLHHDLQFHPEGHPFEHTIRALKEKEIVDRTTNLSILFHDVGKSLTKEDGDYIAHESKGSDLIQNSIKNRLRFSSKLTNTIAWCCENHMRALNVRKKSKILDLVNHPDWEILKSVVKSDITCRGLTDEKTIESHFNTMEKKVEKWEGQNHKNLISGNLIMKECDIEEGPLVGEIKQDLCQYMVEKGKDIDNNRNEIIEEMHKIMENKK